MKRTAVILLFLTGCHAGMTPVKAKHAQAPAGYTQNGYCVPDGINAKTGKYDFIICKTDDGETTTYKRQ